MLDRERFKSALTRAVGETGEGYLGIGRLTEKVMHRALKLYYEPDEAKHEIPVAGSIADIMNDDGIIEIQRASFGSMIPKLRRFLPISRVRIVHPVVLSRRIRWLDPETGEISGTGRTTRGKTIYDTAFEIYKLREFIGNENLEIELLLLECDDYRLLDGWDTTRKRGATKLESIPREAVGSILLKSREDYLAFLPDTLGGEFTEKDFRAVAKSRSRYAYYSLRLLVELSLLYRHREGRAYIYTRKPTGREDPPTNEE